MSVYKEMEKNWNTYCLMSAIVFIEETNKPHRNWQIKKYKEREYKCLCFSSLELRMKDKEFIEDFLKITRSWERKKQKNFVGPTFNTIKVDSRSKQYKILLTPTWLSHITSTCGKIPNEYSYKCALDRINHIKQRRNEKLLPDKRRGLLNLLSKNKKMAAGAFIVSFDLEFRGIQNGVPSLCMSEKFKDFLEFMLNVAQKWGWTNNKQLSPVDISNSIRLGIKASPQFEFRINSKGLQEIYALAGPLAIKQKDKCIKFHTERSKNYVNLGGKFFKRKTKEKIYKEIKKLGRSTSTELQFVAGVGMDVVLDHLHSLERKGKVKKQRHGKRYVWSLK